MPQIITADYEQILAKDTKIYLNKVTKGRFLMGSHEAEAYDDEKAVRLVTIEKDFYIGLFPVTQAIWATVMEGHQPSHFTGKERPVERISWQDIRLGGQDDTVPEAFLNRLNQYFPKPKGFEKFHFRLPSAAEWEYAAKGGHLAPKVEVGAKTTDHYFKYAGSDKLKEVAWFATNAHRETKAVGLKVPNQLGLFDMTGNVWEWCEDDWHSDYKEAPMDGRAWIKADRKNTDRVVRGGSWYFNPRYCRVAVRFYARPSCRRIFIGFRLVLSL